MSKVSYPSASCTSCFKVLHYFLYEYMSSFMCVCTWVCGCLPSSAVGVGDSLHGCRDPNSNWIQRKNKLKILIKI